MEESSKDLVKDYVSLFTEPYFGKEVGGEQVTVTQGQA